MKLVNIVDMYGTCVLENTQELCDVVHMLHVFHL